MTEQFDIHGDEQRFLPQLCAGLPASDIEFIGDDTLPSAFAVTAMASATVAAAASAAARVVALTRSQPQPAVVVDRHLVNLWFGFSIRPLGWPMPSPWDPIAGDYRCDDGWIRLHTNAPHHRRAALDVLGCDPDREQVAAAASQWTADDLEIAVVTAGGCAAMMRRADEWADHPQGTVVGSGPVIAVETHDAAAPLRHCVVRLSSTAAQPLAGVRVLDLTRVLAGPVATRFLAGLGADVLRIDPLQWDEPGVVPEVTLGKRCTRLDLRTDHGLATVTRMIATADIVIHGYRPGALDGLGLGTDRRRELNPGIVDVSLSAYGLSGPWGGRRGFDSLVQMSTGIAHAGMMMAAASADAAKPTPLPVQALDHGTGYLLAAAALHGWCDRLEHDRGSTWTASLARTASLLVSGGSGSMDAIAAPRDPGDENPIDENTAWGPARRLRSPVRIGDVELQWPRGASDLGSEITAAWADELG